MVTILPGRETLLPRYEIPSLHTPSAADWSEANIVIPASEPQPGPLQLAPYQRRPLEDFSGVAQTIAMMICSQWGKTLIVQCMTGYGIQETPSPILIINCRESDTMLFRQNKLQPFLDTPAIKPYVAQRGKWSTGTHNRQMIEYRGGVIMFGNSGSPASMRGRTARYAFPDECDAYEGNFDAENPLEVIQQRVVRYGRRGKFVPISTPVGITRSLIEEQYLLGTMRRWFVKCECQAHFVWDWDQHVEIYDTDDGQRDAYLHCPDGCVISNAQRWYMNMRGSWIAEHPERTAHESYHFNQLSSVHIDWAETKRRGLPSEGRSRGFRTQCLALPHRLATADAPKPGLIEQLYIDEYPEDFRPWARMAAVDVQGDRIEYSIVDFQDGELRYAPALVQIHAAIARPPGREGLIEAFRSFDDIAREYRPSLIFVDSKFQPNEVSDAVRLGMKWAASSSAELIHYGDNDKELYEPRVRLIKGYEGPKGSINMPLIISRRADVFTLATDEAKTIASDMAGAGALSINRRRVPTTYARGLASEQFNVETSKWEPIRPGIRNEPLDCYVYALAARMRYAELDIDVHPRIERKLL